jgi:hypothetical protein
MQAKYSAVSQMSTSNDRQDAYPISILASQMSDERDIRRFHTGAE